MIEVLIGERKVYIMVTRRPFVAGNWKMNGLKKDGLSLAKSLVSKVKKLDNSNVEIVICPPYTLLASTGNALKGTKIKLGGQDCHFSNLGPHTGDISASMVKDAGCKYVIIGHSERRINHREGNRIIKKKAEAALLNGLTIILCIGETLNQRITKKTQTVIRRQIVGSLPENSRSINTIIAYEPIWAIGTGKTATPSQAQEVHKFIRHQLAKCIGLDESKKMRIVYGGSVKPENAKALLEQPDVDGGLVGGASLVGSDFFSIIQSCS